MANLGELVKRLGEGDQESRRDAMKELATQTDVNHKANRRPAFQEVGLVAAVIKVINEDTGLGKEKGCHVLRNIAMAKENKGMKTVAGTWVNGRTVHTRGRESGGARTGIF